MMAPALVPAVLPDELPAAAVELVRSVRFTAVRMTVELNSDFMLVPHEAKMSPASVLSTVDDGDVPDH
jgi:hypothetical protein